jgi:hypothetical protein
VIVDESVIDKAGETVGLDPSRIVAGDLWAGGSGAIMIACERTGRQAQLVDLDPEYGGARPPWSSRYGMAAMLHCT